MVRAAQPMARPAPPPVPPGVNAPQPVGVVQRRTAAHPVGRTGAAVVQRMDLESDSDSDDDWEPQQAPTIPRSQWTKKRVKGVEYKFRNAGDGTLDFMRPWVGFPKCPHASGIWDVNIIDGHTGRLRYTGKPVNSGRYQHFMVANIIREGGTNPPKWRGMSPPGWTWHHHKDRGRLQLIDRKVHAAFPHVGGESIWGKKP
jgi:hypothetical protein